MKDPQLGLRGRAEEVQLVVENGQTRPVIGRSVPTDEEVRAQQEARVRVAQHWGASASPRMSRQAGITEPLPLRSRTALALRLPQAVRRSLNEGLVGHATVAETGLVCTVALLARLKDLGEGVGCS